MKDVYYKSTRLVIVSVATVSFHVLAGSAQAASVLFEFSATENSFPTITGISNTDTAAGISVTRDLTGGNFIATTTTDGAYGTGFDSNAPNTTAAAAVTPRYKIDLGSSIEIATVNSYSYGDGTGRRAEQIFTLYGSNNAAADTSFDETDGNWTAIASVDSGNTPGGVNYGASSITDINESYQYIMWVTTFINQANANNQEHTIWKEFDVIAVPEPSSVGLAMASALLLGTRRNRRKD